MSTLVYNQGTLAASGLTPSHIRRSGPSDGIFCGDLRKTVLMPCLSAEAYYMIHAPSRHLDYGCIPSGPLQHGLKLQLDIYSPDTGLLS